MTKKAKAAALKIDEWRRNPILFVQECFKARPDTFQEDFLVSIRDNKSTVMKACKGPGKTTSLSWGSWWFLTCFDHSKIPATSITADNLRDGLWAEMSKWQQKSPFHQEAFTWTKTRIYANDHPETWFMTARAWSKSANKEQQANTLAGLHADNILFVIDEVGGIPDAVVVAAEAAMSTVGGMKRQAMAGNPTHLTGPLYRACTKDRSYHHVIEITGDPDDPRRSARIDIEWARKQIASYGRDNPWVLVNVFGKFPPNSLNALLGPDDMQAAMERVLPEETYRSAAKSLGVDVARQGDDRSVIFPRQGLVMFKPKIYRIPDIMQVAHHVARAEDMWHPDAIFVDETGGYGAGVVDKLRELNRAPIPVQFGGKPLDPKFKNKRAEMAWNFANWIKGGGCLPNMPELTEEATAITYFFDASGRLQIIEKEQVKEEIGRSCDLFDGGMLNFAYPVAKKDPLDDIRRQPAPGARGDYNPLGQYENGVPQKPFDDWNPLA